MNANFLIRKTLPVLTGLIILVQFIIYCNLPLIQDQNDSAIYYMNVYYPYTGHFIIEDIYPSFNKPSQLYPFFGYSVTLYTCKIVSSFLHVNWTTIVKCMQFLFYVLTWLMFIKIANRLFNSKTLTLLTGIIYLVYYPHFNLSGLVMSETHAIFILSLCVLLFIINVQNYRRWNSILLFILCGHLILIKPVFSLIVLFFIVIQLILALSKRIRLKEVAIILFVLTIPAIQILFSMKYFDNMQIRPGVGRNLWNRVITHDKLIPVHSNKLAEIDSIFAAHNEKIPFDNWWFISSALSRFGYTENETIEYCGAIAMDGILENKSSFFFNTFKNSYINYNYGLVNRQMHCSQNEYQLAINGFNYDRNHTPLVTELLKQSFSEKTFTAKLQNANCSIASFSSNFYFLYHNFILIFLFIISGIYFFYRLIKFRFESSAITCFTIWWCGFSIILGSNLTEFPQSRLILPAVMYVILSVISFLVIILKKSKLQT